MVVSPTQQEIRKAIYWAMRYLNRFYRKIYTGTYGDLGIINGFPSLPLTVYLHPHSADPANRYGWYPPGDGRHMNFAECDPFHTGYWCEVPIQTVENTGESWKGYYYFPNYFNCPSKDECPIVLYVEYAPDTANPKRMKAKITMYSYRTDPPVKIPDRKVSVYLNGELLWDDASTAVGQTVEKTVSADFGCFPSIRYTARADIMRAFAEYYYGYPINRKWGELMKKFLDSYGFFYPGTSMFYSGDAPMYRLSDNYPNDYPEHWCCKREIQHDCDLWQDGRPLMPSGRDCFPYWSYRCLCRLATVDVWLCTAFGDQILVVTNRAIHLMNKYKDPTHKEYVGYFLWNGGTPVYNSAEDYLLKGFYAADKLTGGGLVWYSSLKDRYEFGKGTKSDEWHLNPRIQLAAFAELGYGFGYEEAKAIADDMAQVMLKCQWGKMEDFTSGKGRTIKFGTINRPDHVGGFFDSYKVESDNFYQDWVPKGTLRTIVEHILEFLGTEDMPSELGIFTPTRVETTLECVRALRIYEYYKYRLKV